MQSNTTVEPSEDIWWSEQRAAAYLGLAAITVKVWRLKGRPIAPVFRFGKRVRYKAEDVRRWADSQRAAP